MPIREIDLDGQSVPESARHPEYRVLYVEDEDVNWEVTKVRLERFCYVRRARNAQEAVEILSWEPFEIILMDIQLMDSSYDGIQLTRLLRAGTAGVASKYAEAVKTIPIVFVTAYAARYSKEALIREGGNDLVTKPVDFSALVASMAALAANRISDKIDAMKRERLAGESS